VTCPRCAAVAAATQEYCLQCGLRLPGSGRFGYVPLRERRLALPLLLTLAAAAGGAVAAIAATRDAAAPAPPIEAIGGSVTIARAATGPALADWPANTDGWTIVLQSLPKGGRGKTAATAIAVAARKRKLPQVGIIDSGRFASLHPGYWTVFTGVYETQPDANGALQQARTVVKTAHVQRIAR
jgi:hypothetical protein